MAIDLESSKRLNTRALRSSEVLDLAGREALIMRAIGRRSLADRDESYITPEEQAA